MKKHFEIVGHGVGVVVGCGTFPTWNTYPGLFAALATGNAVIVKPHSNAILPAAITVRTIRTVLAENGIDPNLVTLCVAADRATTQKLVTHAGVKSIDFTGGNVFGQWLVDNCRQARVYAELAGVNNIVIDSTDAYKPMLASSPSTSPAATSSANGWSTTAARPVSMPSWPV
jgi:acyl-CoA reductase-like NAD-dependent aldehyde dehydrogenase